MTQIKLTSDWRRQLEVEGLVIFVPNDDKEIKKRLAIFSSEEQAGLLAAMARERFTGKKNQVFTFPLWLNQPGTRVLALGLGPARAITDEVLRQAAAASIKIAVKYGLTSLGFEAFNYLPTGERAKDVISDLVEGIILAQYKFNKYKPTLGDDKDIETEVKQVFLYYPNKREWPGLENGLKFGFSSSQAVMMARDLVNEPASLVTPAHLVEMSRTLSTQNKAITCTILDRAALKQKNFGGLLGVSQGSDQEPYLIHLIYKPGDTVKKRKLFLVGKGVTFDSGGLSLKPAEGMESMKMDMAGAAAVLAVFKQLTGLAPKVEVHGIIATCENMPSGGALKPGDIIQLNNQMTVEVLNTDAEGRLILADALAYAVKQGADQVVDLATLTGACIVALGPNIAGLLANDEGLAGRVKAAAQDAGEKVWELPLEKAYDEYLKSEVADLRNVASGKGAGAITGALFLHKFVGTTAWAHLDIAGPAWQEGNGVESAYIQKGATGFGVRLLMRLISSF